MEVNRFWIKSPIMKKQKLSKELKELATLNDVAKIVLVTCNEDITEDKTVKTNLLDDIAIAEK